MSNYCCICCVTLSNPYKLKCHLSTALHKKRAESNLQFKCACGKSFTKSSNLSRHKKKCNYIVSNIETNTSEVQTLRKENQQMREEMN